MKCVFFLNFRLKTIRKENEIVWKKCKKLLFLLF